MLCVCMFVIPSRYNSWTYCKRFCFGNSWSSEITQRLIPIFPRDLNGKTSWKLNHCVVSHIPARSIEHSHGSLVDSRNFNSQFGYLYVLHERSCGYVIYFSLQSSNLDDDGMGQLMTSVTVPIFDRRNHTVKIQNNVLCGIWHYNVITCTLFKIIVFLAPRS